MPIWLVAVIALVALISGIAIAIYVDDKRQFYAGTLVLVPQDANSPIEAYVSFTKDPKIFKPGQLIYLDVAVHSQQKQE